MNTKLCPHCKESKPMDEFYLNRKKNSYISWCKQCTKNRAVVSRRELCHSSNVNDRLKISLYNLLARAQTQPRKKHKMEVSITVDHLREIYRTQRGKCFYTGVEMKIKTYKDKPRNPFLMSLDRIDSGKGYIPSNVVLCCCGINYLKNDSNFEEMYRALKEFYEGAKKIGKI